MASYDDLVERLPSGQLVCRWHGNVVCRHCGVDNRATIFPTMFVPPAPNVTPDVLFPPTMIYTPTGPVIRYTHHDDRQKMLIYTDGSCSNNGQPNARAGWAFVFQPPTDQGTGCVSARLEDKGPFGDPSDQTSNRAELRAIIAALRFRHWTDDGFKTIVFATDSEYVAKGATEWARTWVYNEWTTAFGGSVKNRDLWQMLLDEVDRWDSWDLKIQFWRIPREFNGMADRAARRAAEQLQGHDRFYDY